MIRRDIAEIAIRIQEEMPRLRLETPVGSPIREMAQLSRHPWRERLKEEERTNPLVTEIREATTTQLPGMSMTHDVRQTEVVKMFSETLFKRLTVLREDIIPLVETCASRVNQCVVEGVPQTWEIDALPFQALYRSEKFAEFLSPYPASLIRDAQTLSGLSDRSEDEIAALLNTGHTSLNELVVEIVAKYPSNWLREVYNKYFKAGDPTKINTRFNPFTSWAILDELIIVHILSRVIHAKGVIDATIAMSLNDFKAELAKLMVATGATINRCLAQLVDFANAGLVIFNVDRTTNTVYVFEDNYNLFLNEGGTPDAIVGAVLTRELSFNVRQLLENKEALEGKARQDYEEQTLAIRNSVIPRISEAVPAIIQEQFSTLRAEILALFVSPGDFRNLRQGEIVTPEKIGDLSVILGRLVSEARVGHDVRRIMKFLIVDMCLAHLEFSRILDKIDASVSHAKENGQVLGVREACYFAVIDELVEQLSKTSAEVKEVAEAQPERSTRFVYQR